MDMSSKDVVLLMQSDGHRIHERDDASRVAMTITPFCMTIDSYRHAHKRHVYELTEARHVHKLQGCDKVPECLEKDEEPRLKPRSLSQRQAISSSSKPS